MSCRNRSTTSAFTSSIEQRLRVWRSNQTMVEHVLDQNELPDDHVILICDTADTIGGPLSIELAEQSGCFEQLETHRERILRHRDQQQTTIAIVPVAVVASAITTSNPTVAEALNQPAPYGTIFVVIVAYEGSTLLAIRRPSKIPVAGVAS